MSNLFKKIGILTLGLSMALGVGISVASLQGGRVQETKAAVGDDIVFTNTANIFGETVIIKASDVVGTSSSYSVQFNQIKTGSSSTSRYDYIMFNEATGYCYNTTVYDNYYISNVSVTFTSVTSSKGKYIISYGTDQLTTLVTATTTVTQGGTVSLSNSNQTNKYFNFSTSTKNVQVASMKISFTYCGVNPSVSLDSTSIGTYEGASASAISVSNVTNMVEPYTYAWTLESGTSVTLPETKTNSSIAVTPVLAGASVVRCTVTDSTVGTPLTAYAECTVTVSEVLSIEYIRTNISTVTGTKVLTSGTVTTIVDDSSSSKNVYFQDGSYAALAYKASSLDESIVIGSKVLVSGTVTVYKGMLELTSPTISYLDKGSEITPYEITTWSADSLKDMDSRLVTIDLKYVSGSLSDGSKASNVSTLFGETSVIMRSATTIQAVAIYEAYDEFFSKVSTYGTFTFTGILGWFNAPQLAPADILELSSNDVDAVDAVYSLLHMNETVEGQCTTLFGPAKTAVLALSSNQLNMFQNASYYADAKLRYEAWAVNQGEKPYELGLSVANGTIHSESLYIPAVIIVAIASLTALVAFVVIKKKKETNE